MRAEHKGERRPSALPNFDDCLSVDRPRLRRMARDLSRPPRADERAAAQRLRLQAQGGAVAAQDLVAVHGEGALAGGDAGPGGGHVAHVPGLDAGQLGLQVGHEHLAAEVSRGCRQAGRRGGVYGCLHFAPPSARGGLVRRDYTVQCSPCQHRSVLSCAQHP